MEGRWQNKDINNGHKGRIGCDQWIVDCQQREKNCMAFKFENLRVWDLAIELTLEINELVKTFPVEERYVLAQQMQRAADSVALNIAEGSTGQSNAEFKRFLGFSVRSGIEVVSCLYIGRKRIFKTL